jgi:16S rRNA (cytidine1402-2'-O)-methyltransferase
VALVTDSGMPAVSDPGARVVAACRAAGFPARVVPGPSSVTAALALSGFGGRGFVFEGFLPRKPGARRKRLHALVAAAGPVVIFESPYRLLRLLDDIAATFGSRRVFVAREMTKQFEECVSGTPAEIRGAFDGRSVKGEIVVVIAPDDRPGSERGGDEGSDEDEADGEPGGG